METVPYGVYSVDGSILVQLVVPLGAVPEVLVEHIPQ